MNQIPPKKLDTKEAPRGISPQEDICLGTGIETPKIHGVRGVVIRSDQNPERGKLFICRSSNYGMVQGTLRHRLNPPDDERGVYAYSAHDLDVVPQVFRIENRHSPELDKRLKTVRVDRVGEGRQFRPGSLILENWSMVAEEARADYVITNEETGEVNYYRYNRLGPSTLTINGEEVKHTGDWAGVDAPPPPPLRPNITESGWVER